MARRERTRRGGAMTVQQQTRDREKRRFGAALQKGSRSNCRRRLVLGRARTGQLGALPATLTVHSAQTGLRNDVYSLPLPVEEPAPH
jgi:hypothetical protein